MGGVPPVELFGSRPRSGGVNTRRWDRVNLLPPLARAGRHSQCRGHQWYTRRVRTFRRPRRETRVRAPDSSMQALRHAARLPLTSCGIGSINIAQSKQRKWHDPTPYRASTWALSAVQLVGLTTIRTRRPLGRYVRIVSGWGTPRENVSGNSSPNEGTSCDGAGLRWRRCAIGSDRWWAVRAHAHGWLPSVLLSCRCVYPVGVTDEGLPLRVMFELAPITLGRNEITSELSILCSLRTYFFSILYLLFTFATTPRLTMKIR